MPRKRKTISMIVTVRAPSDYHADGVRSAIRSAIPQGLAAWGDDTIILRGIRPIPRGSDMARSRYKPRQETPPMLKLMGVN